MNSGINGVDKWGRGKIYIYPSTPRLNNGTDAAQAYIIIPTYDRLCHQH